MFKLNNPVKLNSTFGRSQKRQFNPLQYSPALWLDASDQSTLVMDGAASFTSASSQYLSRASNATLQTGNVDFWVAGWIYTTVSDQYNKDFFGKYTINTNADYRLRVYSNKIYFTIFDSSIGIITELGSSTYSISGWNFWIAYHDKNNKTLSVSINGGSFSTSSAYTSGTPMTSTSPFNIGSAYNGSNIFDGKIDSCAFGKPTSGWLASNATALRDYLYNSGAGRRSSDFINSSYYAGGNPSGAVSWWDLDERSGTRNDRIGTNHLTDNNSVGYASGIASGLVQYDGDPIKQWLDKSGNARHVTAASDAARPTFKTEVQNGRSVVSFDGTDDGLKVTNSINLSGSANASLFLVAKASTSSSGGRLVGDNPSRNGVSIHYASGNVYPTIGGDTINYARYNESSNTYLIHSVIYDSSLTPKLYAYNNGNNKPLTITGSILSAIPTVTSFNIGWGGTSEYTNGQIAEVIVFPSSLSTSQRQQVERYLAEKWLSPPVVTLTASSTIQHLEWNAVPMATGYEVYYKLSSSSSWVLVTTTTSLWAVVQDLAVGSTYDYRVDAIWSV